MATSMAAASWSVVAGFASEGTPNWLASEDRSVFDEVTTTTGDLVSLESHSRKS